MGASGAGKSSFIRAGVNGKKSGYIMMEKGYVRVDREWKPGDVVQLEIPMPVRRVLAHPEVADDRGMVALERGPLVFCLEGADNPRGVFNMLLPDDAARSFQQRDAAQVCESLW